ncbi:MAG: ferritin-like domain-containing protein [Gemmataceae bacterium]
MTTDPLTAKLIAYIQDAHAMEKNVLQMLNSMIATAKDADTRERLRVHHEETLRHERLLQERLAAHGKDRSFTTDVAAVAGAMVKGVADQVRSDKAGKTARDAYITEHTEIAAYELLERLARRAGDLETARVAAEIRHDEEDMARWISNHWDRFLDQTLADAGLVPAATAGAV